MSSVDVDDTNVDIDIKSLFLALKRHLGEILFAVLLVGVAAFMFVNFVDETFRSETRILIDNRDPIFDNQPQAANSSAASLLDEQGVLSQVEILKSNNLITEVARQLDLASYEEFKAATTPSLFSQLSIGLGLVSNPYVIPAEERVLKEFYKKLLVYKVDRSRVIAIEFKSKSPELAAAVPNKMAEIFLAVQSGEKLKDNSNASAWLEPEIARLRQSVGEAEAKVAAYRAQKGLLLVGQSDTINTQQLADISAELTRVRSQNVDANARARTVRRVLESGQDIETIANVLDSATVQRVRQNEADVRAQIADLSTTLLDAHPRMQALRSRLIDIQEQLRSEARKVLASLENEAVVAQLREQELLANLNELKADQAMAGEEEVELRALEREAASQRELLETYLTQYRQAASRTTASAVSPNARIISTAIVPTEAAFPRKVPIIFVSMLVTFLLCTIWVMLAELFSGRALKTADMVEQTRPADHNEIDFTPQPLYQRLLGLMGGLKPKSKSNSQANKGADRPAFENPSDFEAGMDAPTAWSFEQMNAEFERVPPSILIVLTPETNEMAASQNVTLALARQMSADMPKTILLDLTLDGAPTQNALGTHRMPGLTNLLCGDVSIRDTIHKDQASHTHILARGNGNIERAMAAFERVPMIISALSDNYQTVMVECGATDVENVVSLANHLDVELMIASAAADLNEVNELKQQFAQRGYSDVLILNDALETNKGIWPEALRA